MTIYRGVMVQTNKDTNNQLKLNERNIGFSWTLDKQKGEWFGNRFSSLGDCYLLETKVETRLIMYYLNDMKEQEVIIDPCFIKDKIKVTNLKENKVSYHELDVKYD